MISAVAVTLVGAAVLAPPLGAQAGPVLVVGDSVEVGTGPHLRKEVGSTPITIDALTGRPSSAGIRILRQRLKPEHEVVVFDLGTNDDPSQTAALGRNLATARDLAGGRCLVVATLRRRPLNGVRVDGMNRVIRDFASANTNVRLIDWDAAVRADPGLLARDRVHATPAGYAERAGLVAAAIGECGGSAGSRAKPDEPDSPPPLPDGPPARTKPTVRAGTSWIEVVTGTAIYQALARYVNGTIAMARAAGGDTNAAVSPPPPELRLGEESGSGRRAPPGRGERRR